MPELPEVETIARGLHKRVAGDAIESVWLGSKPQTMKSPPAEIATTIEHTRISSVRRMGKHIVFDLERNGAKSASSAGKKTKAKKVHGSRSQWIVHLGMTCRMVVCEPDAEIVKHTHAIAKLRSGRELRFVDPRRFGRLSVQRAGRTIVLPLNLVAAPERPPRDAIKIKTLSPFQGAVVMNLSPAVAEELSLENAHEGVVVADVPEGSTAANVGVQKGDLILVVNGQKIATTRDLEKASAARPDYWKLTIERGGQVIQTVIGG